MEKEMICISCPVGCRLKVTITGSDNINVTGNQCNRGEIYGREEVLAPRRTVTAVVKTNSLRCPYVPVKTAQPLLREHIPDLLNKLYAMELSVPLSAGDVVISDYNNTKIDVVLTRNVPE